MRRPYLVGSAGLCAVLMSPCLVALTLLHAGARSAASTAKVCLRRSDQTPEHIAFDDDFLLWTRNLLPDHPVRRVRHGLQVARGRRNPGFGVRHFDPCPSRPRPVVSSPWRSPDGPDTASTTCGVELLAVLAAPPPSLVASPSGAGPTVASTVPAGTRPIVWLVAPKPNAAGQSLLQSLLRLLDAAGDRRHRRTSVQRRRRVARRPRHRRLRRDSIRVLSG